MATQSTGTGRKPGRPSKGPRQPTAAILPQVVRDEVDRRWVAEGWDNRSDYLTAIIASAVGLPEVAPKPKTPQEERLIA